MKMAGILLPAKGEWVRILLLESSDEKLGKAATDLSFVLRSLQKKCVNQGNGVGLNFLVGAVSMKKEGRGD